ncbi:pneumococcal-type histidine triad protein [Streptococcus castoreus]|uniref:pneumococcal-type histidine triad protein n=1 Tax=Streptococcus castoreus TaxID=254786 RepID=UPI00040F5AD2|nr:pneumococcal-type histidine triad protein [Streptococcus castoreus]
MSKRIYLSLLLLLVLFGMSACGSPSSHSHANKNNKTRQHSHSKEKVLKDENHKTPEQINKEEKIAAEQIVVSVSDDGFVTLHGDHYHFYNGEVPFDSLFSSELLTPKGYQFNASHVVTEINNGYIVKVNDNYYVYLKDQNRRENLRTVKEN